MIIASDRTLAEEEDAAEIDRSEDGLPRCTFDFPDANQVEMDHGQVVCPPCYPARQHMPLSVHNQPSSSSRPQTVHLASVLTCGLWGGVDDITDKFAGVGPTWLYQPAPHVRPLSVRRLIQLECGNEISGHNCRCTECSSLWRRAAESVIVD